MLPLVSLSIASIPAFASVVQKKTSPLMCVPVTHCIKVPDSLEREPLPEAHPVLLSHRRGPSGFLIYMSPPHK